MALVDEREVRERVEARKSEIAGRRDVVVAVEADTGFVDEIGRPVVVFAEGDEVVDSGNRQEEGGQRCCRVDARIVVVDLAPAEVVGR